MNALENRYSLTNILLNGSMTSLLNSLVPHHEMSSTKQNIKLANFMMKFNLMPSIADTLKHVRVFLKGLIFLIGTCIVLLMSHTLLFILI